MTNLQRREFVYPQEIIEPVWDSRAEILIGTMELDAKDAFHDGLSKHNETLLTFEVDGGPEVQNDQVLIQLRVLARQQIKVDKQGVNDSIKLRLHLILSIISFIVI